MSLGACFGHGDSSVVASRVDVLLSFRGFHAAWFDPLCKRINVNYRKGIPGLGVCEIATAFNTCPPLFCAPFQIQVKSLVEQCTCRKSS